MTKKSVKNLEINLTQTVDISPPCEDETAKSATTLFGKCVELTDFIQILKFHQNRYRGCTDINVQNSPIKA